MLRLFAAVIAIAGSTTAVAQTCMAQTWPAHPLLVVSPFAPSTTNDLVAQMVLDPVVQQLGQSYTLENRPGGNGTVGVASVVNAKPDGYTLLLSSSAMSSAVILHKSLPYDALNDLAPVAMLGVLPSVLMAAPAKGYRSVADLVAAAKAHPGELKFASAGVGSASHLVGERFRLAAGLDVQHVPYRDPSMAMADLAAGRIDFYFLPLVPALPFIRDGKATALAVSASTATLPAVRTLAETGYPIDATLFWDGLSAPAKTPRDTIDKLNAAVGKMLDAPAIRNKFQRIGMEPMPMSADQFAKFFADDVAAMIKLGKDAHIAPVY
jgi:tripartite-type tricarboxylate transporter receptor subunit TctC